MRPGFTFSSEFYQMFLDEVVNISGLQFPLRKMETFSIYKTVPLLIAAMYEIVAMEVLGRKKRCNASDYILDFT